MGNSSSTNQTEEEISCMIEVGNICGGRAIKDILSNHEMNEIVLCKTYSYPKGTFTAESTKYFNHKEKSLFYFCKGNNIAAIRYLTIQGVHINTLDQDRTSPLHVVCNSGSLQLVEEIINQGAMINMPDIVGWTALHVACHYKRNDVILLMLKHGANLNNKNRDGIYPIDLIGKDVKCRDVINNFIIYSYSSGSNLQNINNRNNMHVNQRSSAEVFNSHKSHVDYDENINKTTKAFCDVRASNHNKDIITDDNYATNDFIGDHCVVTTEFNVKENDKVKSSLGRDREQQIKDELDENSQTGVKPVQDKTNKYKYHSHNIITNISKKNRKEVGKNSGDCSFISANSEHIRLNTVDEVKNEDRSLISKQILDLYKIIPKKHKFYETFKNGLDKKKNTIDLANYCSNQSDQNRETLNNLNDEINLHYLPTTLPTKVKSRSLLNIEKKSNQSLNCNSCENIYNNNFITNDYQTVVNTLGYTNNLARSSVSVQNRKIISNFLIEIPKTFPDTNNLDKINIKASQKLNPTQYDVERSQTKFKTRSNSFEDFNTNLKNQHQNYKSKDFLLSSSIRQDKDNPANYNESESKFINFIKNNYTVNCRKYLPYCNIDSDSEKYQVYDSLLARSDDSFEIDQSMHSKNNQTINYYKSRNDTIVNKAYLNKGNALKQKNRAVKKKILKIDNKDALPTDKSQEFIFFSSSEEKDLIDLDNLDNINDVTPVKDHTLACAAFPRKKLSKEVNQTDLENSFILSEEIAVAMRHSEKSLRNPFVLTESVPNLRRDNYISEAFIYRTRDKNTKKIIDNPDSEIFFKKINLGEIFFEIFEIAKKEMEIVMSYLYFIDPKFALSFFINLYGLENKYENFAKILKNEISDKFLRGLILNSNYENEEISRNFISGFFELFKFNHTNFIKCLEKCFKSFSFINYEDITKIDEISKIFASSFSKNSKPYSDSDTLFNSEHSIYTLIFSLIVTDINLKNESLTLSRENVNKYYYDMMIILKNLNAGKNFNSSNLKEYFNFIKIMGLIEIPQEINKMREEISLGRFNFVKILKNEKSKQYNYIFLKQGFLLLFKNNPKGTGSFNLNILIDKVVFLKYEQFYHYKYQYENFNLHIESKQNRKTILIFSNENTHCGYTKFSSIDLQFNSKENLKQAEEILSSK